MENLPLVCIVVIFVNIFAPKSYTLVAPIVSVEVKDLASDMLYSPPVLGLVSNSKSYKYTLYIPVS